MHELRPYQQECLDIIDLNFIDKSRQLIQLPTGSGKTVIFWNYISNHSKRSLIIVPSLQLMHQCHEMGWEYGSRDHTSMKGGTKNMAINQHHIVVANSLARKHTQTLLGHEFDTIICDEAHRAVSKTYMQFFDAYMAKHPQTKVIGLTATPERSDCVSLMDVFHNFTYSREIYDLIAEGYLSELKAYRYKTNIQIKKATFRSGDFTTQTLIRYLDNETRNKYIFNAFDQNCRDRKTLVFCINKDHSIKISNYFKERGVSAAHIDGMMTYPQRNAILSKFRSGEIQVLTNCQLLTEGFDEPTISALIIARPTKSKALYTQMIGRGVRLCPGKENCLVLDIVDNYHSICNFSVLAGFPASMNYEYPDGITIRESRDRFKEMECQIESIDITEANLFYSGQGILDSPSTQFQLKYLHNHNIPYFGEITFGEAAFMIWKNKLMRKQGRL